MTLSIISYIIIVYNEGCTPLSTGWRCTGMGLHKGVTMRAIFSNPAC